MTILEIILSIGFIGAVAVAIYIWRKLSSQLKDILEKLKEALSGKRSAEVLRGHLFEKLFPWAKTFPLDIQNLTPIYNPIDAIHFGQNKITFIELKSGQSQLSSKQKNIKKLVEDKKIEWKEFRN